jgi:hypothetical protein
MAVMRGAIVAIIVSFVSVAARAQEAKPCPSGHICPVCTEQDGVRSMQGRAPWTAGVAGSDGAAGYLAVERRCVTAAGGSGVHYRCGSLFKQTCPEFSNVFYARETTLRAPA